MSRAAQLFRQVHGLDQATGDIISFESNAEMSLETATETVVEIESTIASLEQHAQTLDDVACVLGNIAASMESCIESGGAYPNTVWYANLAIEAQLARIDETMDVISHESVGGALTRVEATQATSTAAASKLKALWERIMAALRTAWEHVVKFFRSIFTATGQLKKRAQALLDTIHELGPTKDVTGTFALGEALELRISVDGRVDYPLAPALTDLSKLTHELAQRSVERGKEQAASLAALLALQGDALFNRNQMYHIHVGKFVPPAPFKHEPVGSVQYHSGSYHQADVYTSPTFPGERTINVIIPQGDLSNAAHYAAHPQDWARDLNRIVGNTKFKVVQQPHHEVHSDIKIMSLSELEELGKAVIETANTFDTFNREAEAVQNKAEADLKKVNQNVMGEHAMKFFTQPGHGAVYATLAAAYARVARQLLVPSTVVCGLTVTVATDFLKVGELSLQKYQTA